MKKKTIKVEMDEDQYDTLRGTFPEDFEYQISLGRTPVKMKFLYGDKPNKKDEGKEVVPEHKEAIDAEEIVEKPEEPVTPVAPVTFEPEVAPPEATSEPKAEEEEEKEEKIDPLDVNRDGKTDLKDVAAVAIGALKGKKGKKK